MKRWRSKHVQSMSIMLDWCTMLVLASLLARRSSSTPEECLVSTEGHAEGGHQCLSPLPAADNIASCSRQQIMCVSWFCAFRCYMIELVCDIQRFICSPVQGGHSMQALVWPVGVTVLDPNLVLLPLRRRNAVLAGPCAESWLVTYIARDLSFGGRQTSSEM